MLEPCVHEHKYGARQDTVAYQFFCFRYSATFCWFRLRPHARALFSGTVLAHQVNAQIVLGDRPVEITLQRAWGALSFRERLDLARSLVGLAFERAGIGGRSGAGGGSDAVNKV